jgi:hypothetical protein
MHDSWAKGKKGNQSGSLIAAVVGRLLTSLNYRRAAKVKK